MHFEWEPWIQRIILGRTPKVTKDLAKALAKRKEKSYRPINGAELTFNGLLDIYVELRKTKCAQRAEAVRDYCPEYAEYFRQFFDNPLGLTDTVVGVDKTIELAAALDSESASQSQAGAQPQTPVGTAVNSSG